eukprot:13819702-Ditylum_brightwellii.AAC.1
MMAAEATPFAHPGTILIPVRCDNSSDAESISDDRSTYKIDDMAFLGGEQLTKWMRRVMVKKR